MSIPPSLSTHVAELLREAAREHVLPRFQRLAAGEVEEKSPGEVVTIADREAEIAMTPRLLALLPGSRVVGEEAVAANPRLVDGLESGLVWLLDPVDGTSNFAAGDARFAMMAALLRDGVALAAWILHPVGDRLAAAELGAGATLDGAPLLAAPRATNARGLHGALHCRFMPAPLREAVEARGVAFASVYGGIGCAGHEYPGVIAGDRDFSLYWRTLPWDHVPGTLLLTESGGHAARLDGTPYTAADGREGLLVAASREAWDATRAALGDALA